MASSTRLKRAVSNTYSHPDSNRHHEIFLDKSSSSSPSSSPSSSSPITDGEHDGAGQRQHHRMSDCNLDESDQRSKQTKKSRTSKTNHQSREVGSPMIQELLQSNMDLKKEIRDIRRQIQHASGVKKQHSDYGLSTSHRSTEVKVKPSARTSSNRDLSEVKILNGEPHSSSTRRIESDDDLSMKLSQLQRYKKEAATYKEQLDKCQETISQLRQTIYSMEKYNEPVRTKDRHPSANACNQHESSSTTASTDHRFIHELFHLCIKSTTKSSRLKTKTPSHQDMKTFIRQTFVDLIQSPSSAAPPSSSLAKMSAKKSSDIHHFICKCSERTQVEHRPTYQYCLTIVEQCQSLFDVTCFTQLSTALNELYYRYGELTNFKRSIASTLSVTASSRSVSCPKLVKLLQQVIDDAKSNELITFKKMAKINDMNEAVSKIRSYDDFVPYYHKFIEQMANLLEVSKGDEIMSAIKTLKLLAHGDSRGPSTSTRPTSHSLARASSMNIYRTSRDDDHDTQLRDSKSVRALSPKPPMPHRLDRSERTIDDSEQTLGEREKSES